MNEDNYFFEKSIMTGTHLMMGNTAMVEGCLAAGCRFFAGYPVTPQNEVPERMSLRLPEVGMSHKLAGMVLWRISLPGSLMACLVKKNFILFTPITLSLKIIPVF